MCGITGFISCPPLEDLKTQERHQLIKQMTSSLYQRGPDDEGYFLDNSIALGMRRLAVIDLTGGHQPITNETKTVQLICNGEIYNYKELRDKLISKNHIFASRSDAEVIVHLYEELGVSCIDELRGMFAFAVWDAKNKQLLLARDRLGQKPLYYSVLNNNMTSLFNSSVIFGSEPKALLQHPAISRQIDWEAIDYYLSYSYIPAPFSIYKFIKKLLPGHLILWKDGNATIKRYWSPNTPQDKLADNLHNIEIEMIRNMLHQSIRLNMLSDIPIGSLLSGGIDSAVITAIMQNESTKPVNTFTLGFPNTKEDETVSARYTSNFIGTNHTEFTMPELSPDLLFSIIKATDEPFADPSMIPTYILSKGIKEHVTVALSGDGGDELFAGYDWLRLAMLQYMYHKLPYALRKIIAKFFPSENLHLNRRGDFWGQASRFIMEGVAPSRDSYFRRIRSFTEQMKSHLYINEIRSLLQNITPSSEETRNPIISAFNNYNHVDFGSKILHTDISYYLPDNCLFKIDRMSMANSLEIRSPFLDHHLVEYVISIPFRKKFQISKRKPLLAKTANSIIPAKLFTCSKKGFSPPVKKWLYNSIPSFVTDILFDKKSFVAEWSNIEFVQKIWQEFYNGHADWSSQIWTLLMLELWHRHWIKGTL